jgi:hypothetical protein
MPTSKKLPSKKLPKLREEAKYAYPIRLKGNVLRWRPRIRLHGRLVTIGPPQATAEAARQMVEQWLAAGMPARHCPYCGRRIRLDHGRKRQ